MMSLTSAWTTLGTVTRRHSLASAGVFLIAGMIAWGGFNWSLELTNTETFCLSCHSMKAYIHQDLVGTSHYTNRTGVRATCPDCHVPKEWVHKVARKIAASNELYHWIRGTIDTPAKFEARRPQLARRVWAGMKSTDSRECRNCHGIGFMNPDAQTARASTIHKLANEWRSTCIDCHKGIVHTLPQGFDASADMDEMHDRIEAEGVECRLCHEGMAGPPPGDGWD